MNDSNDFAIRIHNLSKMFKIYPKPSDMLWELVTNRPRHKPFWALKDISFEVKRGQVVGIVGRNGAGKSTLLKIITGTLDRTAGDIQVNGRISSILELGTGFNGEFSGRDNIYIGGLMVGLSSQEITSKMDWIIQFSELEDFIDQPFKTYSTGMQARLTFSTAVCIDPDVLIIDEALSVGDARFQRKSFDKIAEFRRQGRTILLVSHNTNTISEFCDYAILLDGGRIYDQGDPYRIGEVYYKMLFASESLPSRPAEENVNAAAAAEPELDAETMASAVKEIPLETGNFVHQKGYTWWLDLSEYEIEGDTNERPKRSIYILCENGVPLRPGHWTHEFIRQYGKGAYSHWGKALYFSTSDNSDPRTNGRAYCLKRMDLLKTAETIAIREEAAPQEDQERAALRAQALEKLGRQKVFYQNNPHLMRMGNKKAEILDYGIMDEAGNRTSRLVSGKRYTFFSRTLFYEDVDGSTFGFVIRNLKGVDMFGTSNKAQKMTTIPRKKGDLVEADLAVSMWLTNGAFFLTASVADPFATEDVQYDLLYDGFQFDVRMKEGIFTTSIVNLDAKISIVELN
jgi:ABC-type polysaccharide/polyol phosphate transport system ATPase subunit